MFTNFSENVLFIARNVPTVHVFITLLIFYLKLKVELINDNLFEWYVRVYDIDPESELAYDMREQHISSILLHMIFPDNFPFAPPFMRVVEPKIEKGFVMNGGAICKYYGQNITK